MPSRSEAALRDILENVAFARELADEADCEQLASDRRTLYAATRCLEIISEASRRLDAEIKERNPHLPWREIADAGNIYRHVYDSVDPARVWKTLTLSVPELEKAMSAELDRITASPAPTTG